MESTPSNEEVSFAVEAFDQLSDADEPASVADATIPVETPPEAPQPVAQPQAVTTPEPTPAQTPASPASAAPAQVLPPGQVPPAAPASQPAAATPETEQFQQLSPEQALESLRTKIQANRNVLEEALASSTYKLSDKEVEEIQTNAEVAIPKLLARSHVDIVTNVLGTMSSQIPQMIMGVMRVQEENRQREDKFYSAWPMLDRGKHGPQVARLAAAYRQVNPNASYDEMVRVVGAQAVVSLGLTAQLQAQPPAKVQAPQPPRQPPFAPASAVRTPAAPQQAQPSNLFELYDQMIMAEQRGDLDS